MSDIKTVTPDSLALALDFLNTNSETTTILSGGTDLMVSNASSLEGIFKENILNLLDIKELNFIKDDGNCIKIGPTVSHTQLAESEIIKQHAFILSKCASIIGGPQIRNRGTIGGNICNASPAGDLIPSLFVLDGKLKLKSSTGERIVAIEDFANAPRKTILGKDEILVEITVNKTNASDISDFQRVAPRKSLAITKASVALFAENKDGKLLNVKIALGSVGPTVIRAKHAEKLIEGSVLNEELVKKAVEEIGKDASPIADIRSTAEYRSYILGALLKRILEGYLT